LAFLSKLHRQGRRERVRAPVKTFVGPPCKGGQTENLYTKSKRQILNYRVPWPWSVQSTISDSNEKDKNVQYSGGPDPGN
jgi:hypothetical protein